MLTPTPLEQRLKHLEDDLKREPPGITLSADLPFALFRYDPHLKEENEWRVRREIQNLKVRVENAATRRIHLVSLADLFWRGIAESEGLEALVEMERREGFAAAQR